VTTSTKTWSPADGGACSIADPELFFPEVYDDNADIEVPSRVKYMCEVVCPFGRDGSCLKWAMNNDAYGFWAGTSRYQRNQLGRDLRRVRCPGCRSDAIMVNGRGQICLSCGISWMV